MKTTKNEQQKVDQFFRSHGFTKAGGIWGDAQWKKLSAECVVSVGQCYESEVTLPLRDVEALEAPEGLANCPMCASPDLVYDDDERVETCRSCGWRGEVFDRRCVVTVIQGDLDPQWKSSDGETPFQLTRLWTKTRVAAWERAFERRLPAAVQIDGYGPATFTRHDALNVYDAIDYINEIPR